MDKQTLGRSFRSVRSPGVVKLPGKKGKNPHFKHWLQGKVFTSNDQGGTWDYRQSYPFVHARIFRNGSHLHMVGDTGSTQIVQSSDGGTSWQQPKDLTSRDPDGDSYVHAPTQTLHANGNIYFVGMKITDFAHKGEFGSTHAAVVMRAKESSNLMKRSSWTFSEPVTAFSDLVPQNSLDYFGMPFFSVPRSDHNERIAHRRWADRLGWRDAHIFQIQDPNHYWYDPSGKTFHILAAAATHRSNFAALAKMQEDDTGHMTLSLETTPAGTKAAFIPLPGGNMKFHILFDDVSKKYWLVSNQMRDSLTRADKLPPDRQGLPSDEDQRLQLHFSSNLVDWCFAGYVNAATTPGQFLCDPSLAILGNDLCVIAIAGTAAPGTNHNATSLLFHSIPAFRDLVYR